MGDCGEVSLNFHVALFTFQLLNDLTTPVTLGEHSVSGLGAFQFYEFTVFINAIDFTYREICLGPESHV